MKVTILLGLLIGLVIGAGVCARYLRQEVAANIGPRLQSIERQLDALRAEVSLATELRLSSLNQRADRCQNGA
jgi:hypothetical protein